MTPEEKEALDNLGKEVKNMLTEVGLLVTETLHDFRKVIAKIIDPDD